MVLWRKPKREETISNPSAELVAAVTPAGSGPGKDELLSIGRWIEFKGELCCKTNLRIDGKVEGEIRLDGRKLIVGATARIKAEIQARVVVVRGEVDGDIAASDRVEVLPSGVVRGNIRASRVILAEGSSFNGDINREGAVSATDVRNAWAAAKARRRGSSSKKNRPAPGWTLVESTGEA